MCLVRNRKLFRAGSDAWWWAHVYGLCGRCSRWIISVPTRCTLQAESTPVLQPFLSWGAIFTNPKALVLFSCSPAPGLLTRETFLVPWELVGTGCICFPGVLEIFRAPLCLRRRNWDRLTHHGWGSYPWVVLSVPVYWCRDLRWDLPGHGLVLLLHLAPNSHPAERWCR